MGRERIHTSTIEVKKDIVTVRIHDDFCVEAPQDRIVYLEQLITDSYKRRNAILPAMKAGITE